MDNEKTCVIIGASHAGVNCAFALRKEGWEGEILLIDSQSVLPYHRPPLSKTLLSGEHSLEKYLLKSAESYEKQGISLLLGSKVEGIDRNTRSVQLQDGRSLVYDKLVIATGARPLVPPIEGIDTGENLFLLRTIADARQIRRRIQETEKNRAVIIGGGFIGLEVAASLRKLGVSVNLLEREDRILARVTVQELSEYYQSLHERNGVDIHVGKNVTKIENKGDEREVICSDGTNYLADLVLLGVGIEVNVELAKQAGLEIENGIKVDAKAQTSDRHIYAIGDCSHYYHPEYKRYIRLESVQNAVDQAKVAAATICGKEVEHKAIPWFWSDQYDVKLQMVGLSSGYTRVLIRKEKDRTDSLSLWYFDRKKLLAVDAVNNARAYMLGTKFIKSGQQLDTSKLVDPNVELRPNHFQIS